MKQTRFLLGLGMLCACSSSSIAQSIGPSTFDAAGASISAGGTTHEYAIGQIAGNAFSAPTLIITPGVLQPASSTGVSTIPIAADALRVFPSPVETDLFLKPAFGSRGTLAYNLIDAAGKLVLAREAKLITGSEQQVVALSSIAAGQYTLRVSWNAAAGLQTSGYKIQKLK